jgi:hypothetical protein
MLQFGQEPPSRAVENVVEEWLLQKNNRPLEWVQYRYAPQLAAIFLWIYTSRPEE